MVIFCALIAAGFIILLGGSLFGHDHDGGHDHAGDHGGHDHDGGHNNEPTVSIFSPKVIGTFIMGFGGGGAVAQYEWGNILGSSLAGLLTGFLMACLMYFVMKFLYGQQSTSLVQTDTLIGKTGTVTSLVDSRSGQVTVRTGPEVQTYLARSSDDNVFAKGTTVQVVEANGSELVVSDVKN